MLFERIYHRGLAQASYLIGCQAAGAALVVDPNRTIEQYLEAAARHGLRITDVAETHIHADFVSGARELASRTGATLRLSAMGGAGWQYAFAGEARPLRDGDTFAIGGVLVRAVHTPGHSPEHIALLVSDGADSPVGLLSGDFVFVGDVGRPDLLERAVGVSGTMTAGARQLFASLERFRELPEHLQVWPGHGAGSPCGRSLGAMPQSTVGYELRRSWALQPQSEREFVAELLRDQPEPPPSFARIKRANQAGPAPRPSGELPQITPEGLAASGAQLVDVRPADAYAAGHIPGAINIPPADTQAVWAGWVLPLARPVALVGDDAQVRGARAELQLIGVDAVVGMVAAGDLREWPAAPAHQRLPAAELAGLVREDDTLVLDVRRPAEHAAARIPGAVNIPLGELPRRLGEIPRGRRIVVHCQGGYRSAIAAGLLRAGGWDNLIDIRDGFAAWEAAGAPIERS